MKLLLWLRARAENVAVIMITVIFATFLLQIFARYALPFPIGWTQELCQTLWLWLVFWAGAFCLDDRDHIKFDTLYLASPLTAPPPLRPRLGGRGRRRASLLRLRHLGLHQLLHDPAQLDAADPAGLRVLDLRHLPRR